MSRSNLAAQLRSHAKLFRLGQHSAGHAQLAQLLEDAADHIEWLEASQRIVELAAATGHSLADIVHLVERINHMEAVKPLSQIGIDLDKR